MPIKMKDADGVEIDALTPAEVEAKLKEKETELNSSWEAKMSEQKTALDTAISEKKVIEGKLANSGNQDHNFKTLKEALDKKDADIVALQKSVSDSETNRVNEVRDTMVKKMAGGDKDLEKKILHHFNETLKSAPGKTQEEITQKLQSALKLSVDTMSPSVLAAAMSGANGPGIPANQGGAPEFTATEKALGAKLGITEEDYKKYGPRLKSKK